MDAGSAVVGLGRVIITSCQDAQRLPNGPRKGQRPKNRHQDKREINNNWCPTAPGSEEVTKQKRAHDKRSEEIQQIYEHHGRVRMKIIVSSEAMAVRLEKVCTLSPSRYSVREVIRSPFVTPGEAEQLLLRIRETAFARQVAEPSR